jgi:hypothetical protein
VDKNTTCTLLLVLVAGCSTWSHPPSEPSELPPLRPTARSTTLDIVFVRIPQDLPDPEAIWIQVDEQHIPPALRQQLAENGIRCGLAGSQLPAALQELIESTTASPAGDGLPQLVSVHRISFPPGQSREIMTSPIRDQMIVLHNDGRTARGATYHEAQGGLRMRCQTDGQHQARVWLLPEIHHGPAKSRIDAGPGGFQMIMRRDIQAFEPLGIETSLAYGQHLLVTCSDPPKGLGANLFADAEAQRNYRQLLLIRLAELPPPELFPTAQRATPLADSWEGR